MQTSKPVWTDIFLLIIIVMEFCYYVLFFVFFPVVNNDRSAPHHAHTDCSFLGHVPISMKHLCILLV